MKQLPNVLTSAQAAALIGISIRGFFYMVEDGKVKGPVHKIGQSLLWDKEAILAAKKLRATKKKASKHA